ncbi:MAG: cell division protein FtsZ [Flavobacteriaceae bacterium]|jgi:cell division protein FtsZ|uniref:cell division protein FtsZ n=1 Tax=Candidatus Marifrigoribacter sp. Uisw_064 TaxID=3230970 RepID=UPI003ADBC56F
MSSNTEFDNISFDLPKNQSNVIKVIGVGGGGSNAINHMFRQGIKGVDFVICNTDSQALDNSPVPVKIQLGVSLTEGLGAGANPKVGEQSAVESFEEIKTMLTTNTKMIFITAGMGGGTGTGAAPIIAKMAKEMNILTVGIVTIPFEFEGKMRNDQARIGVEKLRDNVDSLIVINNNKLREVYGNLGFKAGFSKADEVLATAAKGIAEVITHHYTQNIDLRDARTVLADSGTAIMGSSSAGGSNRAQEAISKALDSPLLNDNKIKGATNVLLLIVSGTEEITIDEIGEISDYIQAEAGNVANIIMGVGEDESLEEDISITVIATGFNVEQQNDIVNTEAKKIIHTLEEEQKAEQILMSNPKVSFAERNEEITSEVNEIKEEAPSIIKHTLFEEEEEVEEEKQYQPFEGYIETSDIIKEMDVVYNEVDIHHLAEFKQIEINKIDVNDFVIVNANDDEEEEAFTEVNRTEVIEEEQMLMFDLPISETVEQQNTYTQLEEEEPEIVVSNVNEIEVKDPLEVIPVTAFSEDGMKRYSLDDYQEMEDHFTAAKPVEVALEEEVSEGEIVLTKKTIETPKVKEIETGEPADPLNTPISKLLCDRTDERRRKMKEFNYKFRKSASKIDEIEKEPAYKRMGIELDEVKSSDASISRTSVNIDDDDIELRSNNSFLHDNVD